jgi:hypothetical protein
MRQFDNLMHAIPDRIVTFYSLKDIFSYQKLCDSREQDDKLRSQSESLSANQ